MPACKTKARSQEENVSSPEEAWHNTRKPPRSGSGSGSLGAGQKRKVYLVCGGEKVLRSSTKVTARRSLEEEAEALIEEGGFRGFTDQESQESLSVLQDAQNLEDQIPTVASTEPTPDTQHGGHPHFEPNQLHEEKKRNENKNTIAPEREQERESEDPFDDTFTGTDQEMEVVMTETSPSISLHQIGELLDSKLDSKLKDVARTADVNSMYKAVSERVENHDRTIRQLEQRLAALEEGQGRCGGLEQGTLSRKRAREEHNDAENPRMPTSLYLAGARSLQQEEARVSEFEWARKSMRIWPILGNNKEELRKNLDDFLRGALLMPRHEVDFLAVQEITQAKPTSSTQVHDEIIVTFSDARDRDEIYRKAGKLAPYRDEHGKPTAGFRQEVPTFLISTHKLLTETGFQLKRQHGKQLRWYIKYDDEDYSLYLEVKMPESGSWQRLSPSAAREIRERTGRRELLERRDLLSSSGINFIPLGARKSSRSVEPQQRNPNLNKTGGGLPGPAEKRPSVQTVNTARGPEGRVGVRDELGTEEREDRRGDEPMTGLGEGTSTHRTATPHPTPTKAYTWSPAPRTL